MPLNSEITDGVVYRNDTESGVDYKFVCNRGFVMNGSNHVTCREGIYNGSAPNCLPKGVVNRFFFLSTLETLYLQTVFK